MHSGRLIGIIALMVIIMLAGPAAACTPSVTKTGLGNACQNTEINYTVKVDYYNEGYVYTSKVVDTLPSGVTYVSSSDGGIYDGLSNPKTVTWYYTVPNTGGSKNFYITVVPTTITTSLTNKAQAWVNITKDNLKGKGTWQYSSDAKTYTSKVSSCNAAVTIKGPETVCTDCEKATYDIGFTYTGLTGYDGKVVYELPAGVSYISASTGGVYNSATRTVTWEYKSMGTSASKALQVTINPQGGSSPLVSSVKAYLKPSAYSTYSSIASGTNQWTTQIIRCITGVTISGEPTVCKNCEETSYTLGFTYSGVAGYYGKVVYELPAGTTYISSHDGTYDSATRTVSWEFGPMSTAETKGPFQVTLNPQGGSVPLVNTVNAYIKPSATALYSPGASATNIWTTEFIPCIPEYPTTLIPATMVIGFLGIVLYIRKTR